MPHERAHILARVEQYLAERRRVGFEAQHVQVLRSFASHVQAGGHRGPLTVELMAAWARGDSEGGMDRHVGAALKHAAPVHAWLQHSSRHRGARRSDLRAFPGRQTPHIYREGEIIECGRRSRLGPERALRGGLRPCSA